MSKTIGSPLAEPERARPDLSPATLERYRLRAERERSKALAQAIRWAFRSRRTAAGSGRVTPLPAE